MILVIVLVVPKDYQAKFNMVAGTKGKSLWVINSEQAIGKIWGKFVK